MESWPDWLKHTSAILLGAIALGLMIWRLSPLLFFKFLAIHAEGRITNWMSVKIKGLNYFYPLVEFTTQDGTVMSYRASERCENRPMYPVGTKVGVRSLKKDPKNARTSYPEL
jgi:hypothetical protein